MKARPRMLLRAENALTLKISTGCKVGRAAATLSILLISIGLTGCVTQNYGDSLFRLQMASQGKDVMWVPTKIEMAHEMLLAAGVKSEDIVYDLGSGDGVIPIEAARKYGVSAVGIEYNPDLVELSKRNARRAGVENRVSFHRGDIFVEDFSPATVLTLYLGENLNTRLMPKILTMRPGTRVVSNTFRMEAWIPDREIKLSSGESAFLWIVPAQIDGLWDLKSSADQSIRRLQIRQKKQFFDGTIDASGREKIYFEDGRIQGQRLEFEFSDREKRRYVFEGSIQEGQLKGVITQGTSRTSVEGNRVMRQPR